MAKPTTREELKQYCLRRLGQPISCIDVDDEQLEDRIDDALQYYRDFHLDGTFQNYAKHVVTQTDKNNEYLTLSDDIQGVRRVFDVGDALNLSNLFNIRYQVHLNDLWDFSSSTYVPYVNAMRHIETIEEIFVGHKPIRFNRHMNRLYIEMDWNTDVLLGDYIIIDAYQVVNPETYPDVWADPWLQKYMTALFKRQWGENITKFSGVQLPGGITFDGVRILNDALAEIEKMEQDMIMNYSLPVADMTG